MVIESLTSYGLSIAASVSLDLYKQYNQSLENELKKAFNNAMESWSLNPDIRRRNRIFIERKIKEILKNPEQTLDIVKGTSEVKAFFKCYEKALPQYQIAFDYIKSIQDAQRYKEIITEISEVKTNISNLNVNTEEIKEGVHDIKRLITETKPVKIDSKEIPKYLTPQREFTIDTTSIIGRNDELDQIENNIHESEKISYLRGIGGIGKTTIIKFYIAKHNGNFNHIAWLSYNDSLENTVCRSMELIDNLNISFDEDMEENQKFELIMNKLNSLQGKNILILDNVQKVTNSEISKFPSKPNWDIVCTSRYKLKENTFCPIKIEGLIYENAKTLFSKHYSGEIIDDQFEKLLNIIGSHTLTIELLAKTLETNFTIKNLDELIIILKEKKIKDETWQVKFETSSSEEESNLRNHLLNVFDISNLNEDEKKLLLYLSVLPPIMIKGSKLLKIFNTSDNNANKIIDTLNQLAKKGWLNQNQNNYSIHAIIQEIVKVTIPPTVENCSAMIDGLSQIIIPLQNNPIEYRESFHLFTEYFINGIEGENHKSYELIHFLSASYRDFGSFQLALKYGKKALEIAINLNDDDLLWKVHSSLGVTYRKLGKIDKALEQYEKARQIIEEIENKDIRMVSVYTNLGTVHEQIGNRKNLDFAIECYEIAVQELKEYIHQFGSDSEIEVALYSNLASIGKIYNLQGYCDKAIIIQKDAYLKTKDILGEKNSIVAIHANNVGRTYECLKQYDESLKYYKIAVNIQENILPPEHPELLISRTGLAISYFRNGNRSKAKEILEENLEIADTTFPEKHPSLARIRANLATFCKIPEEINRAKQLYNEAIEIESFHYGADNPNVGLSIFNLGILDMEEQKYNEALIKFKASLEIFLKNYGQHHEYSILASEHIMKAQFLIENAKN